MGRIIGTRWLAPALGIGVLALAILGGSAPNVEAAMGPNPVVVVNTPLPVSGTVTANQGGTWTVKASPTLEAHHEAIEVASDLFVETTPQSRRLFITRLTVVLEASVPDDPPSLKALFIVKDAGGSTIARHRLRLQHVDDDEWQASENVDLALEAGQYLQVFVSASGTIDSTAVSTSGYFAD